jgi:glucokinase
MSGLRLLADSGGTNARVAPVLLDAATQQS